MEVRPKLFKTALSCGLKDLVLLRTLSADNRKSAELWNKFQNSISLVDDSKFVLKSRVVEYATVIRSITSNKLITYSGGKRCAFMTRELVADRESTLDDVCVTNAFAAYTRSILTEDMTILMNSQMQSMGVIFYHDRPIVYLNVLVHDSVFELIENGDSRIKLADYCSIEGIKTFSPIKGSFDELISDSLIMVGDSE